MKRKIEATEISEKRLDKIHPHKKRKIEGKTTKVFSENPENLNNPQNHASINDQEAINQARKKLKEVNSIILNPQRKEGHEKNLELLTEIKETIEIIKNEKLFASIANLFLNLAKTFQDNFEYYISEAQRYLVSANSINKECLFTQIVNGRYFYLQNQISESLNCLEKVIKADPNLQSPYRIRATIFEDQERYSEALEDLKKLSELDPNDQDIWFRQVELHNQLNQHYDALNIMVTVNKLNGQIHPKFLVFAAEIYMKKNANDFAFRCLNQAIDSNQLDETDSFLSHFFLGKIHMNMNQKKYNHTDANHSLKNLLEGILINPHNYSKAKFHLGEAINFNPKSFISYALRARVHILEDNYDEALKDLNKSLELNSNNYTCIESRKNIFVLNKQYKEALDDLERLLRFSAKNKNTNQLILEKAMIFSGLEKFKDAITLLDEAIEKAKNKKDKAFFYYARIDIEISRGECESAKSLIETGFKDYGEEFGYKIRQGALLRKQRKYKEAFEFLTKIIDEHVYSIHDKRDAAYAHLLLGELYMAQQKLDKARIQITKSIQLDPNNGDAYKIKAKLFLDLTNSSNKPPNSKRKDLKEEYLTLALGSLKKITSSASKDIEAFKLKSKILSYKGENNRLASKFNAAFHCLNEAKQCDPDNYSIFISKAFICQSQLKFDQFYSNLNTAVMKIPVNFIPNEPLLFLIKAYAATLINQDPSSIEADLNQSLALSPDKEKDTLFFRLHSANIYLFLGKHDDALRQVENYELKNNHEQHRKSSLFFIQHKIYDSRYSVFKDPEDKTKSQQAFENSINHLHEKSSGYTHYFQQLGDSCVKVGLMKEEVKEQEFYFQKALECYQMLAKNVQNSDSKEKCSPLLPLKRIAAVSFFDYRKKITEEALKDGKTIEDPLKHYRIKQEIFCAFDLWKVANFLEDDIKEQQRLKTYFF